MKIIAKNFRRIERAELAGGPIVFVGGRNGNGKSSILMGVGLALTGWALPPGRSKKDAARMILRGHDEGAVSVILAEGAARATYPKGEVTFDGTVKVSTIAAGLHSLPRMQPDEVAAVLGPYLGTGPSLSDIIDACRDAELPTELSGALWTSIEKVGWDQTLLLAKDKGAKTKGFWERTTGKPKWGSKVGASWRPEGWLPDMVAADESEIAEKHQAVIKARDSSAVGAAEMERLAKEAEGLEDRQKAAADAAEAVQAAEADVAKAEAARKALPDPDAHAGDLPCPHCGGLLKLERIDAGSQKLVAAADDKKPTAEALKRMRVEIARADGTVANLRSAVVSAKQSKIAADVALARTQDAADALAKATEQAKAEPVDLAALEAELSRMRWEFSLVNTAKEAARYHMLIEQNALLQGMLEPEGLRKTVLVRSLDKFNTEHLAPLCDGVGWPRVAINADLSVRFGEDDWFDLGESHRWLAERIIQIAIAKLDGSGVVIMDGADICDADNRNKLFGLIMQQPGVEILVGMTMNRPELMQPMVKAGIASFWVENGITKVVS